MLLMHRNASGGASPEAVEAETVSGTPSKVALDAKRRDTASWSLYS